MTNILSAVQNYIYHDVIFILTLKDAEEDNHSKHYLYLYLEGFHSHLAFWFSLSTAGHMPGADINTRRNEIFKIKEKLFPIKISPFCDPEDAVGISWRYSLCPNAINLYFIQLVQTMSLRIPRFSNIWGFIKAGWLFDAGVNCVYAPLTLCYCCWGRIKQEDLFSTHYPNSYLKSLECWDCEM